MKTIENIKNIVEQRFRKLKKLLGNTIVRRSIYVNQLLAV